MVSAETHKTMTGLGFKERRLIEGLYEILLRDRMIVVSLEKPAMWSIRFFSPGNAIDGTYYEVEKYLPMFIREEMIFLVNEL